MIALREMVPDPSLIIGTRAVFGTVSLHAALVRIRHQLRHVRTRRLECRNWRVRSAAGALSPVRKYDRFEKHGRTPQTAEIGAKRPLSISPSTFRGPPRALPAKPRIFGDNSTERAALQNRRAQ